MATKKTVTETVEQSKQSEQTEPKFSKEQIVSARKYESRIDFLKGNLKDGQEYSFSEVDSLIDDYMKGQVK